MLTKKQFLMRNLHDIFDLNNSLDHSDHLDIAAECIMDGNIGSANEHLVEMLYGELASMMYEVQGNSFFRFTSLPKQKKGEELSENPVLKDILTNSLTLSNPSKFNDPMDPILEVWFDHCRHEQKDSNRLFKLLKDVIDNHLRISCIASSKNDNSMKAVLNPLMWAHYSCNHKGICVQYDLSNLIVLSHNNDGQILRMSDVRYRDYKILNDFITLDNALLAKAKCWEYEQETRLIYYTKSKLNSDYVPLTGFPIKAIFMGYRISSKVRDFLKKFVSTHNIDLYQMTFLPDDITRMSARKILDMK